MWSRMSLQPIEEHKLIALMVAGAFFALAGLYLLFRRPSESEAARVELLGVKFQASSAGLLVFIVGAALVSVPLVVPSAPSRQAADVPSSAALSPQKVRTTGPGAASDDGRRRQELEPNNAVESATPLSTGTFLATVAAEDEDWFVFNPDNLLGDKFGIKVRAIKGAIYADFQDQDGGHLGSDYVSEEFPTATYTASSIPIDYFIRIKSGHGGTNAYEISVEY